MSFGNKTAKVKPGRRLPVRSAVWLAVLVALILWPGRAEMRANTSEALPVRRNWSHSDVTWSDGVHSLALDSTGRPGIAYRQNTGDNMVRYAYMGNSGWGDESVDHGFERYEGLDVFLDFNANDRPAIAYAGTSDLRYAAYDGSQWHVEIVDDSIRTPGPLGFDGDGNPHIVYCDRDEARPLDCLLTHAYLDASGWHKEAVISTAKDGGTRESLAIDTNDVIHMAVWSVRAAGWTYGYRDTNGWHLSPVSEVVIPSGMSLAVDHSNRPHVSYSSCVQVGACGSVAYAYLDTDGWHGESIASGGHSGFTTSLAIDSLGRPHVAYYAEDTLRPVYAYRDSGWHKEIIAEPESTTDYISLALDAQDTPHVTSWQFSIGHILYSKRLNRSGYLPLTVR